MTRTNRNNRAHFQFVLECIQKCSLYWSDSVTDEKRERGLLSQRSSPGQSLRDVGVADCWIQKVIRLVRCGHQKADLTNALFWAHRATFASTAVTRHSVGRVTAGALETVFDTVFVASYVNEPLHNIYCPLQLQEPFKKLYVRINRRNLALHSASDAK